MLGNGKKMLIVPVVAFIMCAAAFAGIAYAYSATVQTANNTGTADVDYFTIDLYKTNGTDVVTEAFTVDEAGLVVTTAVVIGANNVITATVEQTQDTIYVFAFKVNSENTTKFTIDDANSSASVTATVGNPGSLSPAISTTTALAITGELGGIYNSSDCTGSDLIGDELDVGTTYYAQVNIASITNGVYTYTGTGYTAATMADAIEGLITLNFGISLVVESA